MHKLIESGGMAAYYGSGLLGGCILVAVDGRPAGVFNAATGEPCPDDLFLGIQEERRAAALVKKAIQELAKTHTLTLRVVFYHLPGDGGTQDRYAGIEIFHGDTVVASYDQSPGSRAKAWGFIDGVRWAQPAEVVVQIEHEEVTR